MSDVYHYYLIHNSYNIINNFIIGTFVLVIIINLYNYTFFALNLELCLDNNVNICKI